MQIGELHLLRTSNAPAGRHMRTAWLLILAWNARAGKLGGMRRRQRARHKHEPPGALYIAESVLLTTRTSGGGEDAPIIQFWPVCRMP
ncbi:hypothetical protein [Trebonia sp.]|uniref:hypothetical protein n=1 Tax=Trebonia sp. TaxID=2767075 RepID=UPI0026334EE9|nr:hypothetical protein [Trebonia sp.]